MSKSTTKKPTKATGKKRVLFEIQAEPGSKVSVAGTFNQWAPEVKMLKDKESNGIFQTTLMLAPGEYEYKFFINEDWCIDPRNPNFRANDMGTLNSVIVVE